MARGQRKSVEEKIEAKKELIEALMVRLESEKKELQELYHEKKMKELQTVNELMDEAGLDPAEVAKLLKNYIDSREVKNAS